MRTVRYKTRMGYEAHNILTPDEARERGLPFVEDYTGPIQKGDLIRTDDGFVVEVLNLGVSERSGRRWIRTCTGTFAIDTRVPYVDTEPRESRFTFSGKARKRSHQRFSIEWEAFAEYLVRGYRPVDAYKMVYPRAKSTKYAQEKALLLMRKREVKKIVAKKIQDTLAELEIDDLFILRRYKELAEDADSDSVSIQALNALSEIKGIKGNKSMTSTTKVFMGVPDSELREIEGDMQQVEAAPAALPEGESGEDDDEVTLEEGIY